MRSIAIVGIFLLFVGNSNLFANNCSDPKDTFSNYNQTVLSDDINDIESEYYILSYSWAPRHCEKTSDVKPGDKNYLQCHDKDKYGYVLHGLWPQGKFDDVGNYPRACEGDYNKKIERAVLEKYLCMTPSVWLLQHEYEYHGTCMHDESLESPEKYFETAYKLHSKMTLPEKQMPNNGSSIQWFVDNNKKIGLFKEAIQYYGSGEEWQFCMDNEFKFIGCPVKSSTQSVGVDDSCPIKGNISSNSRRKLYFTNLHPDYTKVKIEYSKGEKCFETEEQAKKAGWERA